MEKALVERLEAAVARLEAAAAAGPSGASLSATPRDLEGVPAASDPAIVAYDEFVDQAFGRLNAAAEKIGGKVLEATKVLAEAFAVAKDLLVRAKQLQKPASMASVQDFFKPLNDACAKAAAMTEGRRPDYFNHMKSVADSLAALAWVAFLGKDMGMSFPTAHVEESWQMAEFYNNKVLVEYRNKDADHVEWAKALKELYIPGLRDYVKKYYPLGPVWGAAGSAPAVQPKAAAPTPKAPAVKGPPPPAPPSAPLFSADKTPKSSQPKQGMSAVFQEISAGKAVTTGLRKVTDDMKTKNRADRSGVVNSTAAAPAPEKTSRAGSFAFKSAPPKLELQMGRKWVVENQVGKKDLAIDDCDSKQSVYVYGCKDAVLQVNGKVNNITVDKCTKFGIVFKDVVAAFEVVNCNGVEVQCQGTAPTISIDNSSGCQLYLSKDSLGASITSAKSSEMNVLVPSGVTDGDWVEHALPQQYIHTFKDGQFITSPVSHSGA
ncbi:cyclase-associated protein 1-like [Lolium rigidum]|uniref:cyclase-associated protein 1-like n=1 Tax=Lolium rigidum TaxID=89674 RepID=UPI001F5DB8AA|nr:cyclase-associated protein 1-like [Lolium rigidum]XP_047092308.1 cyclase-associated protein 1-like [Lolium rigidum]